MEVWWANNQGKAMKAAKPDSSKKPKGVPITVMIAIGKPKGLPVRGSRTATNQAKKK
jgi:hypothetical protein